VLTDAERRVAEVILATPQSVGFGTVADLAGEAGVGTATVVRLATKLGFDGYTALQASVQAELVHQLRPAAEKIHASGLGLPSAHASLEVSNVRSTLDGADPVRVSEAVARLADLERPVVMVTGEASAGVAQQFTTELAQLRPMVSTLAGSEVSVRRELGLVDPASTAIVIDLRRYERWVLDAHLALAAAGVWSIGVTDGMLSPVAAAADVAFVVSAGSASPFDSHVGTLALLNLLVGEVAATLRASATARLEAIEVSWRATGALTDDP